MLGRYIEDPLVEVGEAGAGADKTSPGVVCVPLREPGRVVYTANDTGALNERTQQKDGKEDPTEATRVEVASKPRRANVSDLR